MSALHLNVNTARMTSIHGNISHAMRDNYAEYGVDEYYRKVAASYRNPFFPGIKKVIWTLMNHWWEEEGRDLYAQKHSRGGLKVLDMAAGSGEASLCLQGWERVALSLTAESSAKPEASNARPTLPPGSSVPMNARPAFVPANARNRASSASRPGQKAIFCSDSPPKLPGNFPSLAITATDPYTGPAFTARTSHTCHPLSFTDLASGALPPDSVPDEDGLVWDIIICSFALHLVPPQELFPLCYELASKARWLVVIAPHKKPELKETWGWVRWDIAAWKPAGDKLYGHIREGDEEETELEIVREKVKLRLYRSTIL